MSQRIIRSYSEMMELENFDERIQYLYLGDKLGRETFGNMRYINQQFYTSKIWLRFRDIVIDRDSGCDLGIAGCELNKGLLIHHINPITIDDIINRSNKLFDMENVVTSSLKTHNFIHYGTSYSEPMYSERRPNDTCPWKR